VTGFPGEHPEPPSDLADRSPLLFKLLPGRILYRIHDRDCGPVFVGKTGQNRLDSPDRSFGVLYVGFDEFCAFIETFGQSTGVFVVTRKALKERHLSHLKITQPLTLIDLAASGGLARIDADARLLSGSHAIAQRWSAALRNHPTKPAGLLYPARHDVARIACALFDLPESVFEVTSAGSLLDPQHAALLAAILDTYDFGLIDS
jgi:RES domain-containing protein